jgi:hypothetical protein
VTGIRSIIADLRWMPVEGARLLLSLKFFSALDAEQFIQISSPGNAMVVVAVLQRWFSLRLYCVCLSPKLVSLPGRYAISF